MEIWLIENQVWLRIACFILIFTLLALWETLNAWRPWLISRRLRWARHFSFTLISKLCLRLIFPIFAISIAVSVTKQKMGIFNQIDLPTSLKFILSLLAMDFVIYYQHRLLHKYRFLWPLHRIHHIDNLLDVSTGLRFHPLEEIFSMGIKILAIVFFGIGPIAYLLFEILLNAASLFTHVNVRLSPRIDQLLRCVIVTPGMHRIHHSDYHKELNSNYAFCLSWWDRLFGTYTDYPRSGERKLLIGLEEYRDPKYQTLENMLLNPFNVKHLRIKKIKKEKTKFKIKTDLL